MESSFNPSAAELWGQEVAWALSPIPHPPHPSVALHGIPDWLQWWRPTLMFFIADKILSAAVIQPVAFITPSKVCRGMISGLGENHLKRLWTLTMSMPEGGTSSSVSLAWA
jgi:hypothetical protein